MYSCSLKSNCSLDSLFTDIDICQINIFERHREEQEKQNQQNYLTGRNQRARPLRVLCVIVKDDKHAIFTAERKLNRPFHRPDRED